MQRTELETYLNTLLQPQACADYCPNGLQVQGRDNINKIITGVTASQALLDYAAAQQADAVLVHHGYFWKNESPVITGMKQRRLKTLLTHDINLLAYHLPLDVHAEFGNNVQLAKLLNLTIQQNFTDSKIAIGCIGHLPMPMTSQQLSDYLALHLQREPLVIPTDKLINTIAWCTGAAQDYLEFFANLNVDAYLSGEISERTYYVAKELDITYIAAGHHATERYGVQTLGKHLAERFGIQQEFFEEENPV